MLNRFGGSIMAASIVLSPIASHSNDTTIQIDECLSHISNPTLADQMACIEAANKSGIVGFELEIEKIENQIGGCNICKWGKLKGRGWAIYAVIHHGKSKYLSMNRTGKEIGELSEEEIAIFEKGGIVSLEEILKNKIKTS